ALVQRRRGSLARLTTARGAPRRDDQHRGGCRGGAQRGRRDQRAETVAPGAGRRGGGVRRGCFVHRVGLRGHGLDSAGIIVASRLISASAISSRYAAATDARKPSWSAMNPALASSTEANDTLPTLYCASVLSV